MLNVPWSNEGIGLDDVERLEVLSYCMMVDLVKHIVCWQKGFYNSARGLTMWLPALLTKGV